MKVLATTDTLGGVFTYAIGLARSLARYGVETVIAATGGSLSETQRREVATVPGLVVYEAPFRLEWMDDPWDDVERAGWWLEGLARGLRPDVVHLNGFSHGVLDLGVPKIVMAHSDVLTWWRAVKGEDAPARYDRYREAVRRGLDGADVVLAPTRAYLSELEILYGRHVDARVVPNAVASPVRLRREVKAPLILGAGRLWDEGKNLALLDEVAGAVPWPVYLAGDARHPDGGVRSLGNAQLLGQLSRDALGAWMERCAVLCHPASYEPFGLVPLEAANAGCALVLGDVPSLREIWGDAAAWVPPRDRDALVATLARIVADDAWRASLARAARERAQAFDPSVQARAIHSVYRELAPGARPRKRSTQLHPGCA
jgi:glycosyltransferase involved in cell wall biosynthesis